MSWEAAAVWLEIFSFLLVTLDLWGEERLAAAQIRIKNLQQETTTQTIDNYTNYLDRALAYSREHIYPAIQIVLVGGILLGAFLNISDESIKSIAMSTAYILTAIGLLVAIAFLSKIALICTKTVIVIGLFVLRLAPVQGMMLTIGTLLFVASKIITLAKLP